MILWASLKSIVTDTTLDIIIQAETFSVASVNPQVCVVSPLIFNDNFDMRSFDFYNIHVIHIIKIYKEGVVLQNGMQRPTMMSSTIINKGSYSQFMRRFRYKVVGYNSVAEPMYKL